MHRATESVTGKYCLEVTWQGIHTKGGKGKPNMVLLNWLFRRLRWVDGFKTNMGSTARQQKKKKKNKPGKLWFKISCGKRKEKLCGSGHTSMYALWRLIKAGRQQVGGSQLVLWVNPQKNQSQGPTSSLQVATQSIWTLLKKSLIGLHFISHMAFTWSQSPPLI